jgi:hypothetical protein
LDLLCLTQFNFQFPANFYCFEGARGSTTVKFIMSADVGTAFSNVSYFLDPQMDSALIDSLRQKLQGLGARAETSFTCATHLMTNNPECRMIRQAMGLKMHIVLPAWVDQCAKTGRKEREMSFAVVQVHCKPLAEFEFNFR